MAHFHGSVIVCAMLQMLPTIEDGHIVLHLDGDIDAESAATIASLIDRSTSSLFIDFTDVGQVEEAGFTVLADAIRRCPHRLVLRGLEDASRLGLA
jgi:anti-anti-sigma regulatory factor